MSRAAMATSDTGAVVRVAFVLEHGRGPLIRLSDNSVHLSGLACQEQSVIFKHLTGLDAILGA